MCIASPHNAIVSTKPEIVTPQDVQRIMNVSQATAYRFVRKNRPVGQKPAYLAVDLFAALTNIPRERVKEALPTVEVN